MVHSITLYKINIFLNMHVIFRWTSSSVHERDAAVPQPVRAVFLFATVRVRGLRYSARALAALPPERVRGTLCKEAPHRTTTSPPETAAASLRTTATSRTTTVRLETCLVSTVQTHASVENVRLPCRKCYLLGKGATRISCAETSRLNCKAA